jgi:hypothetical protein
MQQQHIWIAAAWLTLSAFLLMAALHLAFTGRSFEVRSLIRLGRRAHPSALGIEAALAVVSCLIFGVVLFSLAPEQSPALRVGFGAAGSTVLFTGAWWFFTWLRDNSDLQTESLRVWRKRAFQAGERLRGQLEEAAVLSELCRLTADALEAPMAAVYRPEGEDSWVCTASVIPAHVGQAPTFPGIDLSSLDSFRTHLSIRNPGLGLFPIPVSADRAEWLAVTLLPGLGFKPELRTFAELCALHAGAAITSTQSALAYATQQSGVMLRQREEQLWRRAVARLVPPDLPEIAGLDYGAEYWRGQSPEGQFIDLISLPKGALGVVMAEVATAGMESAVQIAQLQVLLRSRFHAYAEDLAELLQSTERALLASSERPFPVRLFCARYSSADRTLTYVNAGAMPPLVLRRTADGAQVLRLAESCTAMAASPPTPFRIAEKVLRPGDLVAISSLSMLGDPANGTASPPGDSRLADSLMSWEDRRASDLVRLAFRTVEEGPARPAADRALILLKAV